MSTQKLKLLLIPLLIVIAAGGAVFAAESKRTPAWQTALDQYAAVNHLDVLQVAPARQPHNFRAGPAYPIGDPGPFAYTADITYREAGVYALALPYPPQQVYCAVIEQNEVRALLFVNYYTDGLWQQGWVVHRAFELTSEKAAHAIEEVGCIL